MAVSGITFIAYRHPVLYEKELSGKIFTVSGLSALAMIMHDNGVSTAFKDLTPFIKDGVGDQVKEVIEAASAPSNIWLGVLCVFIYGFFLSWLADHMKKEYGIEEETEDEEK